MRTQEASNPLVSVAIITYNQKHFIAECIQSVLAQSYSNIEIVVADDGSTDGTQEILLDYKNRFPDKFVLRLSSTNYGITANSNAAFFACKGKYIAWMGGDDLMLPDKIKKQVAFMESNPDCTICYHNLEVFQSESNKVLRLFNNKNNKYREGDIRTSIKYSTFNGACSTMIRRSCAPEHGFNTTLPIASDWLFWVETLASGGSIKYINEILGRYRRHAENITRPRDFISQNELDHLNTCNILLAKYPQYSRQVMYSYSRLFRGLRHKLDYYEALMVSLCLSFNIKALIGLTIWLLSLRRVKL